MKNVFIIFLFSMIFVAGCDSRSGAGVPKMIVNTTSPIIYNEAASNMDDCEIVIQLEGDQAKIEETKINLEYDNAFGLIIGSASDKYVYTDSVGKATFTFKTKEDVVEIVNITATMDSYITVSEVINVSVLDIPDIHLSGNPNQNSGTNATINISLSSESENIGEQNLSVEIFFNDDKFSNNDITTDSEGKSVFTFTDSEGGGSYFVRIFLPEFEYKAQTFAVDFI